MSTELDAGQIALRLFLTAAAGALIGAERETNSRPAGLRTTLLVALAASVAMLQANALMNVRGKAPDSFVVLDLMRLPLGILSGMGFIGAGAILRKDNVVIGVTTAATLWFATVMGLCFGGGQLALGGIAAILGLAILRGLRWFELRWQHDQRATLHLVMAEAGLGEQEVSQMLLEKGYKVSQWSVSFQKEKQRQELRCEVHWRGAFSDPSAPAFLNELAKSPQILELSWTHE